MPLPRAHAQTADPTATAIADGLTDFGSRLDSLGFHEELGEAIPLTWVSPSDEPALRLDRLFGEALADIGTGFYPDLAALQAAIDDLDGVHGGVSVVFDNVTVQTNGVSTQVSFGMVATRTASLPVAVANDPVEDPGSATPGGCYDDVDNGGDGLTDQLDPDCAIFDLDGGGVTTTLQLSTTFRFQYDNTLGLYLAGTPPRIDVDINAGGPISGFDDRFGFMEIDVGGAATLNDTITVDFQDPDSDNRITQEEWTHTALEDLVTVQHAVAADVVSATFTLNARPLAGLDRLPGAPDGTLVVSGAVLTDTLTLTPTVNLGSLAPFDNIKTDDVLAGLASLAVSLIAAQSTGDFPFPFLNTNFSEAYSALDQLDTFLRQQGDAAVICGALDTLPPMGDVSHPNPDTPVYCQAAALTDATAVSWSIKNGIVTAGATLTTTVGPNPAANASFVVTDTNAPQVQVVFTDTLDNVHTVVPRFTTAQELFAKLAEYGFDDSPSNVAFDPATSALTYRLKATSDPVAGAGALGFDDQLEEGAGLTGLHPVGAADVHIDAQSVELDLTFGLILVDDVAAINPADNDITDTVGLEPGLGDRFFVQVHGGPEITVDNALVTATVELEGNLGFVEVAAQGDGAANTFNPGTAFEIVRADDGRPMLALDITSPAGGIPISGTVPSTITNGVLLRQLLTEAESFVTSDFNVQMTGGLSVTAQTDDATGNPNVTLGSGTVAISWTNVLVDAPLVVTDGDFIDTLRVFDVEPAIFGTYSSTLVVTDTLTDAGQTLNADLIGAELWNQTDGSRCVITDLINSHTLECAAGLSGGTDDQWENGDRYRIEGSPEALRDVLLGSMFDLASRMDTLARTDVISGTFYDASLPLAGLSPRALVSQFDTFKQALSEIAAGVPDATIQCGTRNTSPPTGNLSEAGAGSNIYCQAATFAAVTPLDVRWSMTGGTYVTTTLPITPVVGALAAVTATVGISPTANAGFLVTSEGGPGANPDFQVRVVYTDTLRAHSVRFPETPLPASLQDLEARAEAKLGLPPGGLVFEPLVLTHPSGPSIRHLVMRLGQGVCTTGHAGCAGGDRVVPQRDLRIQLDLRPDAPDLVALQPTSTAPLAYTSRAQLDLAFPLASTINVTEVAVLETSGVSVTADLSTAALDFVANVGTLSMIVGTGASITGVHTAMTVTGTYTGTSVFSSTTTLTDTTTNFLTLGLTGTFTLTNTTKEVTCLVDAATGVATHALTCMAALSEPEAWERNNGYEFTAPSTTILYHPGRNFDELVDEGSVVTNTSDGASCTITAVEGNTITCADGLSNGGQWDQNDEYQIDGVGVGKLNADLDLRKQGTDGVGTDAFTVDDFVNDLQAFLAGPDSPNDCGDGLSGDVCARLSLVDNGTGAYLGDIRYSVGAIEAAAATTSISGTQVLSSHVGSAAIDFALFMLPLEELQTSIDVALDGNETGLLLPLAGSKLDAGANIAQVFQESVINQLGGLGAALNSAATVAELRTEIRDQISSAISGTLLLDLNGGGLGLDDIIVELVCDGGSCNDGDDAGTVDDVRVKFRAGTNEAPTKGCASGNCEQNTELLFDVGLPGMSLFSDDSVKANVGWSLLVDVGLSRLDGPYLVVDGNGHESAPELLVGARVELLDEAEGDEPDTPLSVCNSDSGDPAIDSGDPAVADLERFETSERCIRGQIGLLPVTFRDGPDNTAPFSATHPYSSTHRTQLQVLTKVNLMPAPFSASTERLSLAELNDELQGEVILDADANVDLRFRSGFREGEFAAFPSVLGTFHLLWEGADPDGDGEPISELAFKNLYLDTGPFFSKFLEPTVAEVQGITKPLQPVVDTVLTPIPVISDISKMGGGGPVTMITLFEALSGNNLTLIRRLLAFIKFVNSIPTGTGLIPLGPGEDEPGSFDIDVFLARVTGAEVTNPDATYTDPLRRSVDIAQKVADREAKQQVDPNATPEAQERQRRNIRRAQRVSNAIDKVKKTRAGKKLLGRVQKKRISGAGFEESPGISFPFLEDANQIFFILLGQDVTLVRFDFGTLAATAGLYYRFRLFAGPIPVSILIGGKVTVKGRFAMGFDTRGFGPVLSGRAGFDTISGESLLDGIFIDDFNAAGVDVPEIQLLAEVTVGAAVDLVIVAVGVEAGFLGDFRLDFDNRLHDPPGSGKLRIEGIYNNLDNPLCLFVFSGKLEAFFRLFVEINLLFFTRRFTWEPFPRLELLKFEVKCDPPKPVLAKKEGSKLVLNMGSQVRREARAVFTLRENEKFIVRQLTPGSSAKVSVTAFNITQVYEDVTSIEADGDTGVDMISMEPGVDLDGNAVTFTLPATLFGGPGNDILMGGEGNDTLHGDAGNDRLIGRGGNDTIYGESDADGQVYGTSGNDSIDGGTGDDVIFTGGGDDSATGGPGADYVDGDAGVDSLDGGPGQREAEDPDIVDKEDVLVGGAGDDNLRGHFGNDIIFGDEKPSGVCSEPVSNVVDCYDDINATLAISGSFGFSTSGGADTIDGSEGDDKLFGGGGNDKLTGGTGDDLLTGDDGMDVLDADDDDANTNDGNDTLWGGSGDDTLIGRAGHNTLDGGNGNDLLRGGPDPEDMFGGEGMDVLLGGGGNDIMLGDRGSVISYTHTHSMTITQVKSVLTLTTDTISGTVTACDLRVSVLNGQLDISADAKIDGNDTGYFDGYQVFTGTLDLNRDGQADEADSGMLNEIIVREAQVDLNGDGTAGAGDDGTLPGVAIVGNGNADCIYGDEGGDFLFGQVGGDRMHGDAGQDYMEGNEHDDWMRGGQDDDAMHGNDGGDEMYGDSGDDTMHGDAGSDTMRGGIGEDTMYGDDDGDIMFGDADRDTMYGNNGDDEMHGSAGDDTMEGNEDSDTMYGDADQDDMIGGSSTPGADDGADLMHGNAGRDVMAGDNASITRTGDTDGAGVAQRAVTLFDVATLSSPDVPVTASAGDIMFGDEDADLMFGQGNGGDDADDVDDDDDGRVDEDPEDGVDNDGDGKIDEDPGGDYMRGGPGDDYMEGNAGGDTMYGDAGQDDMIGGGSANDGVIDDDRAGAGLTDDGDSMYGNAGDDVMAGDNARIAPVDRSVTLFDLASGNDDTDAAGGDWMYGNDGNDHMYGGGERDTMHGDADDDTMEGNGGGDRMWGDADQDDMIGGTSQGDGGQPDADDEMHGDDDDPATGGDGGDVLAGDNARITRRVNGAGLGVTDPNTGDAVRDVVLFDIEVAGGPDVASGTSDGDRMYGEGGRDFMFGQGNGAGGAGGSDEMHGGPDDDYMEGNHGLDRMYGDEGDDDMVGGSSAGPDGRVGAGVPPTHLADAKDVMRGGADDDVMLGDNGLIERPVDGSGIWLRHAGYGFDVVARAMTMAQTPERSGAYGGDDMQGNGGHDDMVGQLGDDDMQGNDGEDAMVGDLGRISAQLEDGGREQVISVQPFFEETIYQAGTFSRLVELYAFLEGGGGEGNDTMLGGQGQDRMHGGPGNDIMNGNGDQDRLFGDDGQDVMWGGPDHDHLWGGYQDDHLDVRPRPADPADWFTYGEPDNYQGLDLIYGGWHRDALQADVAAPGPRAADRLIDWAGGYNVFYVCPGAYGEGTITRQGSPHLRGFLQQLAEADGALSTASEGSSGFRELGYVFPNERGQNSHPPHPDHPGHFTCGAVEPAPPTLSTTAIDLSYTAKKNQVTVAGEVTVQDQDAAAVKGARLTVQWIVPGSSEPITQQARTDKLGIANFSVKDVPGVYTLTVVDVVLDGYNLDADHSVLSASIDTTE